MADEIASKKAQPWFTPLRDLIKAFQAVTDCEQCGQRCCFAVPIMTYREGLRIQEYLQAHPLNTVSDEWLCEFLTPEGRCHIYPVRPMVCQAWGLMGECKFMKADPATQRERIRAVHDAVWKRYVGDWER